MSDSIHVRFDESRPLSVATYPFGRSRIPLPIIEVNGEVPLLAPFVKLRAMTATEREQFRNEWERLWNGADSSDVVILPHNAGFTDCDVRNVHQSGE